MRFDVIPGEYQVLIKERVERTASRAAELDQPAQGRVVPEDGDLVLGTGRQLQLAILFLDMCGSSSRPCGSFQAQAKLLPALNTFFQRKFVDSNVDYA